MQIYDVGFIPIAKDNKIVGVITDRDIVINIISNNDNDCEIGQYMTKHLICVDKDESIETALSIMGKQKVKRLLVKDKGYLAGIVSLSDIINTDIDEELMIDNLKKIWEINKNIDRITPKVNEFKL